MHNLQKIDVLLLEHFLLLSGLLTLFSLGVRIDYGRGLACIKLKSKKREDHLVSNMLRVYITL